MDSVDGWEYVDITVDIPAGATSLLFGFGINDTYNDGTGITDIQASADFVPEPASIGLIGIAAAGLLTAARPGSLDAHPHRCGATRLAKLSRSWALTVSGLLLFVVQNF